MVRGVAADPVCELQSGEVLVVEPVLTASRDRAVHPLHNGPREAVGVFPGRL
jgi:hypothetical protein